MPAQLDFKAIAENVDIEAVARLLDLDIRDNRSPCLACRRGGDRALEILPETNTFRCYAADPKPGKEYFTGDCIGLYAHIKGYDGQYRAAKELAQHFRVGGTVKTGPDRDTVSATPRKAPAKEPARNFDPDAFLQKLTYSEDVHELASEEDAQAFRIGSYRGNLYIPAVYASGAVAGWWKLVDGKLVPPAQWLPDTSNVTRFPKRA